MLEEGIDANGDGRLQAGEIARSYTLGHDVLAQAETDGTVYRLFCTGSTER